MAFEPRFKHYTVQQYVKARKERRDARLMIAAAVVLCFGPPIQMAISSRSAKAKAAEPKEIVWTTATAQSVVLPASYEEDIESPASAPTQAALTIALRKWEKALGASVRRPSVVEGNCGSRQAIACADRENNRISVNFGWQWSTTTATNPMKLESILMHEVGHLLGVPHIVGDPLMDAVYEAPVLEPSPAAVALARIAIRKKRAAQSEENASAR